MRIAVDQDDVMAEFTRHMLACNWREHGIVFNYEDVRWHDLFQRVIPGGWDWLRSRDWLWTKMVATEGSIGGVTQLRADGHTVELLTSKPDWAEWTVWAWLGKWRPPFNSVTIAGTGQHKHDVSDAQVLVDDRDRNCIGWVESHPERFAIVFDRPWNRDMELTPRMYRARDWAEVLATITHTIPQEAFSLTQINAVN